MKLLPPELMHFIVKLSSGSPRILAVLARTHSAFQREADRALYDSVTIYTSRNNSLKCLETLATNPEKALFVHFLAIEYALWDENEKTNSKVTTYLTKSLINMHSLSVLRIRVRSNDGNKIKRLGKILWLVSKILKLLKTLNQVTDSAGNTVKVIFDCKVFTATTFSIFLK